jgi:hypothetical protein
MANPKRASISISGEFFDALQATAKKLKVPPNAMVELHIAKQLGIPFDRLPARTSQWASKVFPTSTR